MNAIHYTEKEAKAMSSLELLRVFESAVMANCEGDCRSSVAVLRKELSNRLSEKK